MYLISLKIQKARSRLHPDKPGKLYLKLIERVHMEDGGVVSRQGSVSTGITAPEGLRIQDLREAAIPYIYNAYRLIDGLRKCGSAFAIDDVCQRLRSIFESGVSLSGVSDDFVWDTEVATLKKELIPLFRYNKKFRQRMAGDICEESGHDTESLLGFLYVMSHNMLSEGR